QDLADVYAVTAEQLAELPGFKDRSISNLIGAIEGSKDRPLWRLLAALNIRHVGSTVAQVLARSFPSVDSLREASPAGLAAVEGVGPEIAQSVWEWFHTDESWALVEKLRAAGVRVRDEVVQAPPEGPLTGSTIVITGSLASLSRS